MKSSDVVRVLQTISDRYRSILESDAPHIIADAIDQVRDSKTQYAESQRRTDLSVKPVTDWGYAISRSPLRFRVADCKGYHLRPDIICDLRWKDEEAMPSKQEAVLRVWSTDTGMMFREEWDAFHPIGDYVTHNEHPMQERVMLRCHFDLANSDQHGPKYHLQIGGNRAADEFCWYPKEFDLPRLAHHPLDLVLLCEAVAANFFPVAYRTTIARDPSWRSAVRTVQHHLLREYYDACLRAINAGESLLNHLWNSDAA